MLELLLLVQRRLGDRKVSAKPQAWPPPEFLEAAKLLHSSLLAAGWTESLLKGHEGRRADHLVRAKPVMAGCVLLTAQLRSTRLAAGQLWMASAAMCTARGGLAAGHQIERVLDRGHAAVHGLE